MKISVSVPEADVHFMDEYARRTGSSRSAAVHAAVEALRRIDLSAEYEQAFREWDEDGDAQAWDATSGDGLP